MAIKTIIACDVHYGIGKDNKLPWPYNTSDMEWFKEHTDGHVVVMGRKTWESMDSRKLPNRVNCVMTHNAAGIEGEPDHILYGNVDYIFKTLEEKYNNSIIWVIGGGELYLQTSHLTSNIYLTRFKDAYECDRFVDPVIFDGFSETIQVDRTTPECVFSIWDRI